MCRRTVFSFFLFFPPTLENSVVLFAWSSHALVVLTIDSRKRYFNQLTQHPKRRIAVVRVYFLHKHSVCTSYISIGLAPIFYLCVHTTRGMRILSLPARGQRPHAKLRRVAPFSCDGCRGRSYYSISILMPALRGWEQLWLISSGTHPKPVLHEIISLFHLKM